MHCIFVLSRNISIRIFTIFMIKQVCTSSEKGKWSLYSSYYRNFWDATTFLPRSNSAGIDSSWKPNTMYFHACLTWLLRNSITNSYESSSHNIRLGIHCNYDILLTDHHFYRNYYLKRFDIICKDKN